MPRAVLGLGGNLGARAALLRAAASLLDAQPGLAVLARSLVYETPALGPPQPDYLNAALVVEWPGRPDGLFALMCHVEQLLGRERRERWGARTIDLDLLLWSGGAIHTSSLDVPHPGTFQRSFVLAPLGDVLPGLAAELGARLAELCARDGQRPPEGLPLLDEPVREQTADAVLVRGESAADLLSDVAGAVGELAGLSPGRARATLPFMLAGPLEACGAALLEQVRGAWAAGFHVERAVVTRADEKRFAGVLLGEQVGVPIVLPRLGLEAPIGHGPGQGSGHGDVSSVNWFRISQIR
jgi:2-amino-4-hydroxy-6-hydroxymethyldihydropteridine diphosphokinase